MAQHIIRVMSSQSNGWNPERYHDIGDLSFVEQADIVNYLSEQGFLVQDVFLEDTTTLRVGLELRKRDAAAKAAKEAAK